jgi:hypothetical protein
MILKKIITTTAKWDSEKDTWWVGEIEEYSWTDMKDYEVSPRMEFSEALHWIIKHDQEKNPEFENPGKIA